MTYNSDDEDEDMILEGTRLVGDLAVMRLTEQMRYLRDIRRKGSRRYGRRRISRTRVSVEQIYRGLGDNYFRRAYRMTYESFKRLHEKLAPGIERARIQSRNYKPKGGREGGMYSDPPVPNGRITTSVRLACAIRYFAGGSPYDILSKYGISHTEMLESVWQVTEAVNTLPEFAIRYPESAEEQRKIAQGFEKVSTVGFSNCAGAIDGILIWMHKPSAAQAKNAGDVCQSKFLCGRKGKFGLNCQAVSDVRGRILDIAIPYGGSSADCIAFERSKLFGRCEDGLMKNGNILFGDNAYLNTQYMATPYSNVHGNDKEKSKDDYNFYHSQLRIRVECSFGMLVQRWGLLRMAMPKKLTITRIVAIVNALARLHNYCIDETDRNNITEDLETLPLDLQYMMEDDSGYLDMRQSSTHEVPVPTELLTASEEIDVNERRRHNRANPEGTLPRKALHDIVRDSAYHRPVPNQRGSGYTYKT